MLVWLTTFEGNRVGRIRTIFPIPEKALASLFPSEPLCPKHLAYVEWYAPFPSRPERDHLMYKINKGRMDGGQRMLASIVPLDHIRSIRKPQVGLSALYKADRRIRGVRSPFLPRRYAANIRPRGLMKMTIRRPAGALRPATDTFRHIIGTVT